MEKSGIVYLMKTVIKGVYKIGISEVSNFEGRMRHLENNGYANVAGLERILAVKTDNYKEKENLLHEIFSKSRIGDTEIVRRGRKPCKTFVFIASRRNRVPEKRNGGIGI
ncbi:T5orf172 domain [Neisseria meningitidis]|nr:T5orf172 domain [Neisseria meningitidis]CWR44343.1 T5orf172 domain [Neisseria meningitidis]